MSGDGAAGEPGMSALFGAIAPTGIGEGATEWVIGEARLAEVESAAYEAGARRMEAWSHMGADGPAVVRCGRCAHMTAGACGREGAGGFAVAPDGFCSWGEEAR